MAWGERGEACRHARVLLGERYPAASASTLILGNLGGFAKSAGARPTDAVMSDPGEGGTP
jgi:hypothetical protein